MHTIVDIEQRIATAVAPSERVLEVAGMFGLGVDDERELHVVPKSRVPLPAGGVIFVTGPSGGGKSTILRCIARAAVHQNQHVISMNDLPSLPSVPLVDTFDLPIDDVCSLLARAGLGDAFVMLRTPEELSDGQRYRLRLAQLMFLAERTSAQTLILADEFGATLDRITASVIARNIRKWITRTPHTFIAATTHDDLLEHLAPDVLIYKDLGEKIDILERHTTSHQHLGTERRESAPATQSPPADD